MDPLLSRSSSGALLHSAQKTAAGPAVLVAAGFIAAAIFVADTLTQLEIAVAVLYVAVILISVRTLERRGVLIVALACVTLTDREAAPLLKGLLTRPAHCHINAGTNGAHGV